MIKWLNEFPQYKNRDLWITGESYAGTYVPWLVRKIISEKELSVTGFMLGNPVLWCKSSGLNIKGGQYIALQFNE